VGGLAPHIVTFVDYIQGFPLALPVSESDAIVRGTVTNARAQLSADRTNVYSEFAVRVERTFKQPEGPRLEPGSTITVLRDGGAVRFPTGVMVVRRDDWTMPLPGSNYVLFLERHSPTDDAFMIVTGYCLDGGTVTPLDINLQSVAWEDSPAAELLARLTE
jgi:hypothetical protein